MPTTPNFAALADFALETDQRVRVTVHLQWQGIEWDAASAIMVLNDTGLVASSYGITSQSSFGELDVALQGGLDFHVVALDALTQMGVFGWEDLLPAGRYQVLAMAESSSPAYNTWFEIEPARELVDLGRPIFLTQRDLDDRGFHSMFRAVGLGYSLASGASAQFSVPQTRTLTGFSLYAPTGTGFDDHEFTVQTPAEVRSGDDLVLVRSPPGKYVFQLDQIAAGDWPGRLAVLAAPMPNVK